MDRVPGYRSGSRRREHHVDGAGRCLLPRFRRKCRLPLPVGRENTVDAKASVIPVKAPVPVLCRVRVFAALVVVSTTFPNASGPPVTLAIATGRTPVPVSDTGEPVTGMLPVMVTVPVAGPGAVGENTTVMVQPVRSQGWGARATDRENGVVTVTAIPVAPTPPELVSVNVTAGLVVPSTWLPNPAAHRSRLGPRCFESLELHSSHVNCSLA